MPDDALVVGEFESRLELQTCDAIDVYRNEVEPRARHLDRQLLARASVASSKEGCLTASLRQVIHRADAEGLCAWDGSEVLGGSAAAMGNRVSGSVHDGQSLLRDLVVAS